MIKVEKIYCKNKYIIHSDDTLEIGDFLFKELSQQEMDYLKIKPITEKPSHQLRKLYFKLIDFLFSQEKRFDLLHSDYVEYFSKRCEFLSKFPTFDSFRKNACDDYRKLLEWTLCHKKGVSDEKNNHMELSELYDNLIEHALDCNINLEGFYECSK